MTVQISNLLLFLGCALVTALPRVLPFIVIRRIRLPAPVIKWLAYIPVCIMTALIVSSLFIRSGGRVLIDWQAAVAVLPALIVSILTKNLLYAVIAGVAVMALLRFLS